MKGTAPFSPAPLSPAPFRLVLVLALAPFGWAPFGWAPFGWAQGQGGILTANLIQNEIQNLPADHSALFNAAREVSITLEIPGQEDLASLEDAVVTVIRPNGETTEVRPDQNGLVSIEGVEKGPHALVFTGQGAHGAKLFYFDEQPVDVLDQGLQTPPPPKARMTLANVDPDELRPFIDEVRDVNAPIEDVKMSVDFGPEFGYRVALAAGGVLEGQVFTVTKQAEQAGLEGTRIAVFSGGVLVASTRCDELGRFALTEVQPGVHSVVAAGREGYAAFAFEAVEVNAVTMHNAEGTIFVSRIDEVAEKLPVVLIPPTFCPSVVDAVTDYYPSLSNPAGVELPPSATAGAPVGLPVGGFMSPSTAPGGNFGGGGGSFTGGSGLGGLGALAGLGVLAAAGNDNNGFILPPTIASPSVPVITPALGN